MIGNQKTVTPEFSSYKLRTAYSKENGYLLELDGVRVAVVDTAEDARKLAKATCKARGIENAGLTELFGRNAQFVLTARGAWKRIKA